MKYFLVCIGLFCTGYLVACRCKSTQKCDDGQLYISTVGYDSTDIVSAIQVRYRPDGAFDSVVDSTHLRYFPVQQRPDTFACAFLFTGYDYKILFPTTGIVLSVTKLTAIGVTTRENYYECGRYSPGGPNPTGGCENNTMSYTINGQDVLSKTGLSPQYYVKK